MGSPPHSWRILCLYRQKVVRLRITSTLVENTIFYIDQSNKCWDHLHTRGEYCHHLHAKSALEGSPPHSWRILLSMTLGHEQVRITSTLVENTMVYMIFKLVAWDHLHTRGEYTVIDLTLIILLGSPPHSWRIPGVTDSGKCQLGITSTLVENTFFPHDLIHRHKDHLHTRGEYNCSLHWQS